MAGFLSRLMTSSKPENCSNCKQPQHQLLLPQGIKGCRFSLAEIKKATNNFDSVLLTRQGQYSDTYKGILNNGNIVIPVRIKRLLSPSSEEVKKEVLLLSQIHHPNLVSLVGWCNEQQESIIVYEYMVNESLDKHLYGILHGRLSWKQRLRICIDIARGIHYLHTGSKRLIVHGDLKPPNILLDHNLIPKLSGFGLSKIGPVSMSTSAMKTHELGRTGTVGYIDPKYLRDGIKTEKVDVYSFGIVLLEVLVAKHVFDILEIIREVVDINRINHINKFISASIDKGTIGEIIDPSMRDEIAQKSLQVFLRLMQDCLAFEAVQRPSMGEVEVGLQLALQLQETIRPQAANE